MCGTGWLPGVTVSDMELMLMAALYQAQDMLSEQLNSHRPDNYVVCF